MVFALKRKTDQHRTVRKYTCRGNWVHNGKIQTEVEWTGEMQGYT